MKTDALSDLIKVSQWISEPVLLTEEEAARVRKDMDQKSREEYARRQDAALRKKFKADLNRKYAPWEYNPNKPPLIDTIMTQLVDNVGKAVSTGAKKTWNATAGFRNRFGNWFKSTLDKPENIPAGQPRFLGR